MTYKLNFDQDERFDFDGNFPSLAVLAKYKPAMVKRVRKSWEDERNFLREHLSPLVLSEDLKHAQNPDHISWEMLRVAGRHGRLSQYIPGFMGGLGNSLGLSMMVNLEEQAALDCAFCGMMGGHGLGLAAVFMTFNMRILQRVADQIAAHQNDEKPYVIDCAITEPTAGTDVEEVELYPKARLMCQAKRVSGGAVLNGRKVFISTGHMATDHVVIMPFDQRDAVNTMGCFLVSNGTPGFSLGRMERKMGQKAGSASELIFEDCLVPEESILLAQDQFPEEKFQEQFRMLLHGVLGITRTAVGAWSTGTARGAFDRALYLAKRIKHKGRTLIHQQWAQALLTNMHINVMMARGAYLESQFALMRGFEKIPLVTGFPPWISDSSILAWLFRQNWYRKFLHSRWMHRQILDYARSSISEDQDARVQFMSSLAKVVGSDMAMENCQLATEFLGQAGLRHDQGVEKIFRDAKLLQIFEGTNQLNRLNIFTHYLARHLSGVEVF
ncbi:MAG: acyl-CoA/acyl-ACP dehydrogenase [Proteobacteria bacterium]|nr:acyl-CoA/acyl-ACP dehydrogenase [Pseudomonadota bacterium]